MQLTDVSVKDYSEIQAILKKTFPLNELQPDQRQLENLKRTDLFGKALRQNDQIVALLLGYQQPDYLFLEYFAVSETLRGQGLGGRFLQAVLKQTQVPVILEVEPPETEISARRIAFYERLGFVLNPQDYQMPDLGGGHGCLKLHLMSYPEAIDPAFFSALQADIYRHIYRV